MAALLFMVVALALLGGFLILTTVERRRELRYAEGLRRRIDRDVTRLAFIFEHVDLAAFLREEVRRIGARLGHDIAHVSLQLVRAVERLLTHLVRRLRATHAPDIAPRENVREFVRTLSDFKEQLRTTVPEIREIQ